LERIIKKRICVDTIMAIGIRTEGYAPSGLQRGKSIIGDRTIAEYVRGLCLSFLKSTDINIKMRNNSNMHIDMNREFVI
jgi:hypothetical protein